MFPFSLSITHAIIADVTLLLFLYFFSMALFGDLSLEQLLEKGENGKERNNDYKHDTWRIALLLQHPAMS